MSSVQKPEDFIGKTFNDGKLKVVGIIGRNKYGSTLYKVTCDLCSKDNELFPGGYFISTASDLKSGRKPCPCSKAFKWSPDQYLIRCRRVVKDSFIIHGFTGEFNGNKTLLNCECPIHNFKWTPRVSKVLFGQGCSKCSGAYKPTEQEALEKCRLVCEKNNFTLVGFPNGFTGATSRFEFICDKHGLVNVNYDSFTRGRGGCKQCGTEVTVSKNRLSEEYHLKRCEEVCYKFGYAPIGFVGGYEGSTRTIFQYNCPIHKIQNVLYSNLVYNESRCPECSFEDKTRRGNLRGYYDHRKDEQDFLYVLCFDDGEYIKVGRSFDLNTRFNRLITKSKCYKIELLAVFTGKHKEIYEWEQELHAELRERNFKITPRKWFSIETFDFESLRILSKLLNISGMKRVDLTDLVFDKLDKLLISSETL